MVYFKCIFFSLVCQRFWRNYRPMWLAIFCRYRTFYSVENILWVLTFFGSVFRNFLLKMHTKIYYRNCVEKIPRVFSVFIHSHLERLAVAFNRYNEAPISSKWDSLNQEQEGVLIASPPKGTLSEAKRACRGRAYRSREDLYSDKIAIWEKKVCSLLGQNRKPSTGINFMENSTFLLN